MFLFRKRPPLTIILRAELLHLPVTLLSPWKSQISMLYQLAVLHFAFYLLYYIIFYLLIFCTVCSIGFDIMQLLRGLCSIVV